MPNTENIKKWVEALRSGGYCQTSGVLRRSHPSNGFCCLGVACDLSGVGEWEQDRNYFWYYRTRNGVSADLMPAEVCAWLGIASNDPSVVVDRKADVLSAHNDSGRTFLEIAAAIEAKFLRQKGGQHGNHR